MIGEHEVAVATGQGGLGLTLHVGEAVIFGAEPQPLEQAEAAGYSRGAEPFEAGEDGEQAWSGRGGAADEMNRERKLGDAAIRHERLVGETAKVGALFVGGVQMRHHAGIGDEAELVEDGWGLVANAVAAGFVDVGWGAEIGDDGVTQHGELAPHQLRRKIAGERVARRHGLLVGRVDPRMKMRADLAGSGSLPWRQDSDGGWRRRHGIVDRVGGNDAGGREDGLSQVLVADVGDAGAAAVEGGIPLELLLGVDDDEERGRRDGAEGADRDHRWGESETPTERLRRRALLV